jgi:L-asparaginase
LQSLDTHAMYGVTTVERKMTGFLCKAKRGEQDVEVSVRVLGTGGTIAAILEDGSLRLLSIGELSQELSNGLPSVDATDLERVASSALQPKEMLGIAREARKSLLEGSDGVVVTHGTDTLEETAYLTDLLLGEDSHLGGVVFTGAMRFASDPSSDGPGNLADAIRLAACSAARGLGVLVSFAGEIHEARWVTKANTSSLRPFTSLFGAIGHVGQEETEIRIAPTPRWPSGQDAETRVALVKAYPGMSGAGVAALVSEGVRGLVIEGFGAMNLPESLHPAIESAIKQGVAVVVGSRSLTSGGLDQGPSGHRLLHDLGATGSYGLSPSKAWVALMVGLARTNGSAEELRHWFSTITRS